MSSSAINCVSLLLLTVPFATTRIKPARTVVKLVTESTIVPSSVTSLRTLSAESVEMLDIWQEIVQTDSVAPTGATGLHLQEDLLALLAVPQLAESVLAMLLTENTR